eukprot:2898627-Rhodomonas_salina.2
MKRQRTIRNLDDHRLVDHFRVLGEEELAHRVAVNVEAILGVRAALHNLVLKVPPCIGRVQNVRLVLRVVQVRQQVHSNR